MVRSGCAQLGRGTKLGGLIGPPYGKHFEMVVFDFLRGVIRLRFLFGIRRPVVD